MQEHIVICDNLIKIYKADDLEVVALQGLNLEVAWGEMIALVGASGSGKTTLMNILSGLDTPDAGRCNVAGYDLARLNEEQRTRYRNLVIGYVWQQSGRNLLSDLTAAANVDLPQMLNGASATRCAHRTRELLERVGLGSMAKKKPAQLSGGEQQRIALAIALANQPTLLLADEPTGEVDSATAQEIIALLRQFNKDLGLTIIIVTHDIAVATAADRTLAIRDGRTSTETVRRDTPLALSAEVSKSAVIGLPGETHKEAISLDHVGILQLPPEIMKHVVLNGRVDVLIATDHIELWPVNMNDDEHALHMSGTAGLSRETYRESILVDRVGRLQLPREALAHIPFAGRADVWSAGEHVELWPLPTNNEFSERSLFVASQDNRKEHGQ